MGQYAKNPAAVFSLKYHLLGCPKYRRPVLATPLDRRLQALLQQKTAELGITMHSLKIMPDHVHLFVAADPTRCLAEMVHRWKGFTSHVLPTEFASWRSRWPTLGSRSSYAGTVGSVSQAVVRTYSEAQKRK